MSPGEQSTLSARLQVAVRNIRLLQKTSEQIKLLRRVHNQLEQAPVELAALLLQAASACRDEIPHLRLDVSALRSPLWVQANEESVRLAVNEVLANACRELRHRQVAAPEIRVLAEVETDVVVLRIRDNGLPIDIPLIDHPFEEDASAYARLNLGTGFGLTFVRETFRMHDGSCSLSENRDEQRRRLEGVTFEARLPYHPTEERGT